VAPGEDFASASGFAAGAAPPALSTLVPALPPALSPGARALATLDPAATAAAADVVESDDRMLVASASLLRLAPFARSKGKAAGVAAGRSLVATGKFGPVPVDAGFAAASGFGSPGAALAAAIALASDALGGACCGFTAGIPNSVALRDGIEG
jgi:hypothetical protein